jgi:hypothetical protein
MYRIHIWKARIRRLQLAFKTQKIFILASVIVTSYFTRFLADTRSDDRNCGSFARSSYKKKDKDYNHFYLGLLALGNSHACKKRNERESKDEET